MKIILLFAAVFLVTTCAAFFFEEDYRAFIRYLFKFFTDEKISFVGKNFHFFASNVFVFSFGFFSTALGFLAYLQKRRSIGIVVFTILLFFAVTIVASCIGGTGSLLECTICNDGRRRLNYNDINYDFYFVISEIIAIIPVAVRFIKILKEKRGRFNQATTQPDKNNQT